MPMQRRLPKYGFTNINRIEYKAINIDVLQSLADKGLKVLTHKHLSMLVLLQKTA